MKKIFNYIIFGNIWIALAAASWTAQSYLEWKMTFNWKIIGLNFFATLLVYNLDRLLALKKMRKSFSIRHAWLLDHRRFLVLTSTLPIIYLFFILFDLKINSIVFLTHLAFLSIFYAFPFIPFKSKKLNLRQLPFAKIFLIAYVWASSTVVLPNLELNQNLINLDLWLSFLSRFLFILAITIPFDIRDFRVDKKMKIKTLPNLLGNSKVLKLAFICLLIYGILNVILYFKNWKIAFPLIFSAILTGFLIWKNKHSKTEYYYAFVLDGLMILQFLLLYLCMICFS